MVDENAHPNEDAHSEDRLAWINMNEMLDIEDLVKDVWDGVRNAGASPPRDYDTMSMVSNVTRASTASRFSTVS
jgi:hypothetical protein